MPDNVGSLDSGATRRSGEPQLLMAHVAGRPEHTPEAEPVVLALNGTELRLELHDGSVLGFDAVEFWEAFFALYPQAPDVRAAA